MPGLIDGLNQVTDIEALIEGAVNRRSPYLTQTEEREVDWHNMPLMHDASFLFIELGLAIVGLAVLARLAARWGFSAIPLYLLAGLAFGNGGLAPLRVSEDFVRTGAEIGILLLLFMLGLEYTGEELKKSLRLGVTAGVIDFGLNFTPGLAAGFLVRWRPLAAVLLGGVTYVSSSRVIAKVLAELRRKEKPETPLVLSVLVQEDLAMAVYLPHYRRMAQWGVEQQKLPGRFSLRLQSFRSCSWWQSTMGISLANL